MRLYDKVYEHITIDAPIPDLVIYLQAPVEVLMARIERRGLKFERYLTQEYLTKINDAYSRFFLDYDKSPVLIINAAEIDFESISVFKPFVCEPEYAFKISLIFQFLIKSYISSKFS